MYNFVFLVEKSCVFMEFAPKGAQHSCMVQKLPKVWP